MKFLQRTLFASLLFCLFQLTAFAQVGRIEQTTVDYEKQRVDALTVTMKPERKDIQQAFDDWMDERYNINMKGGGLFSDKNTRRAEAVNIPAISAEKITLYTVTEERRGETNMTIFASRGLGNFVDNGDYRAFTGLEAVFDSFLSSYLPEYYAERVSEAREILEDLRKDFTDATDDVTKNEEKIRDLERENDKLRMEMKDLEKKIYEAEQMLNKRERTNDAVRREVRGKRD